METATYSRALHCMRNNNTKARFKNWPEGDWVSIDSYTNKMYVRFSDGETRCLDRDTETWARLMTHDAILGEWELSK